MVECQLPKLNTGVRFPSPAPKSKGIETVDFSIVSMPFYLSFSHSSLTLKCRFLPFFTPLVVEKVVENFLSKRRAGNHSPALLFYHPALIGSPMGKPHTFSLIPIAL